MRRFILEILGQLVAEILSTIWFFVRPVVYLSLIWGSMKIAAHFQ